MVKKNSSSENNDSPAGRKVIMLYLQKTICLDLPGSCFGKAVSRENTGRQAWRFLSALTYGYLIFQSDRGISEYPCAQYIAVIACVYLPV